MRVIARIVAYDVGARGGNDGSASCSPRARRVRTRSSFDSVVALAVTGILAASLVGVPLAMFAVFRPYTFFPLAISLWAVLMIVWNRGPDEATRVTAGSLAAVLIVALAFAVVTVKFSSQHVL